ncbi:MAG: 4Fe-4S dicluster domain-containing protein [Deltaproteobacteria bacterium]|nr:4Fe-4S dicluster domain-containing protein [Deltaproteobacteria bacterium]MBW2535557.1 4Fe-4S dicluster domain-containing protein [Deltaproteobacteria bacterium]
MAIRVLLRSLNRDQLKKVAEISGQNVYRCMQCGTCSGVCPMNESMDLTPRQAVLMLQHGLVDEVLEAKTPWVCASCHTCEARCPRGLELPKVMEAIRQMQLRQNEDKVNPRKVPVEELTDMPQMALVAGFRKLTG